MAGKTLLLCSLLMTGGALAASGKLPSSFKYCAQTDPKVNECLKDAVQDALPKSKNGFPKLGVPPIDPLKVDSMTLGQGAGPVSLTLELKNFTMSNVLSGVKVNSFRTSFGDNFQMDVETVTPNVVTDGTYSARGRVLLLPINGDGHANIVLTNVKVQLTAKGRKFKKKDGKDYGQIEDMTIVLTPSKMVQQFDNLFNGDKRLGDTMNKFLNDNWETVYKEIGPSLNLAYQEIFKSFLIKIFGSVPFEDIFPKSL